VFVKPQLASSEKFSPLEVVVALFSVQFGPPLGSATTEPKEAIDPLACAMLAVPLLIDVFPTMVL